MPADAEKTINEVLAENLQHFMCVKGVTQAVLAQRAGMGQTTVSLYLSPKRRSQGKSGKEPSATIAAVQRLADALQVELWELLRPLTQAQRDFYRSMESLITERTKAAASDGERFIRTPLKSVSRKRPPRAA